MQGKTFGLKAEIATADPGGIEAALADLVGVDAILKTDRGFKVITTMTGESARDLNRSLLAALRRVSKMTTLRAEWTSDGVTERFFDNVPRGIRET